MEYVLDKSKWRCGGKGPYHLGTGITVMINSEGYMCCLGQFAKQRGLSDEDLQGNYSPMDVATTRKEIYDPNFVQISDSTGIFVHTNLAEICIEINDNEDSTVPEKIAKLRDVLQRHGHTLRVIGD